MTKAAAVELEALDRLLHDHSPAVRERAVRMGAALLPADSLVGFLRDGADDVRRSAGLAMLKARGPEAAGLAVGLLQDRDPNVVLHAVLLLDGLKDPRALEPLRRVLRHPNLNVVQAALVAIGHLGNAGAVRDLVPFLGADPWVRMAAVEALGDLRAAEAVPHLAAMADDGLCGALAVESLARIGGPDAYRYLATRWVSHGASDEKLLELLAHVVEGVEAPVPEVQGLEAALAETIRGGTSAHLAAARVRLALGPSALDRAALALVAGAWGGGSSGTEHALVPACLAHRFDLIGVLLETGGAAREWGYRLVASHPGTPPLDALVAAVTASQGREHLDAMGEALAAVGGRGTGERDAEFGHVLVALYGRLPSDVRASWSAVLHRHREAIRTALGEEEAVEPWVRQVLGPLVEEDADRAAAAVQAVPAPLRLEALAHVTHRDAVIRLLPWLDWLGEAPDVYGSLAVSVAERAGLGARVAGVRELAARRPHKELVRLLGRLRDEASVGLLARLAQDGPATLRPFALTALGAIGGGEARRALRRAIAAPSPWTRFAFRALAACRTPDDLPVFRSGAACRDWHVRMISAEVLSEVGLSADLGVLEALAADPVPAVADRVRLPRSR